MIIEKSFPGKLFSAKISSKEIFEEHMEHLNLNHLVCPICGAKGTCCIHAYYKRGIIEVHNGEKVRNKVTVLRVKCKNCTHTHAILPDVIIPYDRHGVLFILRAFALRFLKHIPVEKLCEDLGISINLFYRWLSLWRKHKQEWLGMLLHSETSDQAFLESLMACDPFSQFASDFRGRFGISFLQSHPNPAKCRRRRR